MSRLLRRFSRIPTAAAILLLAAAPTLAEGPPPTRGAPAVTPAVTPVQTIDFCTCRAFGERFTLGERICLGSGESARLAECAMSTNVMNWRVLEEPCPRA